MKTLLKKANKIIEIEEFPTKNFIVWGYRESDEQLSSNVCLNEAEMKKLVREKKREGYKPNRTF